MSQTSEAFYPLVYEQESRNADEVSKEERPEGASPRTAQLARASYSHFEDFSLVVKTSH